MDRYKPSYINCENPGSQQPYKLDPAYPEPTQTALESINAVEPVASKLMLPPEHADMWHAYKALEELKTKVAIKSGSSPNGYYIVSNKNLSEYIDETIQSYRSLSSIIFQVLECFPERERIEFDLNQVKFINNFIEKVERLLADRTAEVLPKDLPKQIHFIKDNKLPAPADEEIKRVRQSLPISMAQELTDTLKITDREMATILAISIRTYHRLKQNGLLNPVASERLVLLKDLAAYGLEVFEDQDSFNKWLRLPQRELSDQSPLSSLDTATGFALVKTILGRIDYGVYS